MTQPSLFDYKSKQRSNRLAMALKNRGWITAKNLMPELGMSDRQLREEAEASNGAIVSSNKGYCLLDECVMDDLNHAANRLISQGKKMISRGLQIQRAAHGKIK